ncbi:uncharacterized protein EAF02_007943 [Botrytis sinoallii]|uniref:uncharacterized protein n=1 Tax=Botrytis sinoallii TaxID=1463999 RepID=UPI0019004275|nr:uncharacterized protein EAF02_007943 [Botrytis sinoallii]KAF7879773.1 hypothetical protein EAF02_007943 [Botrytis sinoallii]
MILDTEMLGADNIIDITFGVTSAILTMITIYLMCKHHNSRVPELDVEQGRDFKLNPTIPNSDPVSIPSYSDLRSLPMTLNQAVVSFPIAPQPDILPSTPSYQTASEITLAQHQILEQTIQSFPITTDIATVPDLPGSHAYYHSLQSFFLNESG